MTAENYRAWDINVSSFPKNGTLGEQLRFFKMGIEQQWAEKENMR